MTEHPWKARFMITVVMLLLGVVGLIFADLRAQGALTYWEIVTPIYAILAIGLSWYLRHDAEEFHPKHLLQEVLHWAATVGGVYLLDMLVTIGIMGRFEAALAVIILLGLSTFIAGLYIEPTLIVVGLLLGLFSGGVALVSEYLYTVMIPLSILALVLLYYLTRRRKT